MAPRQATLDEPHPLSHSPALARRLARRGVAATLCLALALAPPAWPQVRLPSLGESASDEVTVSAEKRIGDQIMREIRRDPDYLDDPVLLEYLQSIWQPLVEAARQRGDIDARHQCRASRSRRFWCAIAASTRSRCPGVMSACTWR